MEKYKCEDCNFVGNPILEDNGDWYMYSVYGGDWQARCPICDSDHIEKEKICEHSTTELIEGETLAGGADPVKCKTCKEVLYYV